MNWTPQSSEDKREEAQRLKEYVGDINLPNRGISADASPEALNKELRTWTVVLAFWGLLSIALGGLTGVWGILLLAVAGLTLVFKDPAMLLVFAVTLGWAAVSSITTLQASGVIFGIVQIVLAIQVLRKYRRFQAAGQESMASDSPGESETAVRTNRTARMFPPLGCAFSLLAAAGAFTAFIALIVVAIETIPIQDLTTIDVIIGLIINSAVLALAISLAALVSRFRWRGLSIAALVISSLILLGWIAILIASRSG